MDQIIKRFTFSLLIIFFFFTVPLLPFVLVLHGFFSIGFLWKVDFGSAVRFNLPTNSTYPTYVNPSQLRRLTHFQIMEAVTVT